MERRLFLQWALMTASVVVAAKFMKPAGWGIAKAMAAEGEVEKLALSDDEWKKRLNGQQYDILRQEGTERPFSSPLNEEKHEGIFACAGCGLELFPSKFKFDSGTGWPSFFDAIPGHLEMKTDYKMIVPRSEYHCARCGGHHGHVFNDGPRPTGLRYCNNGAVLTFIPAKA